MAIFIDSSFNEMRTMESLGWYPIRNGTAANKSLGVVTVVMGEALVSKQSGGKKLLFCG
jgi:hypothetical protein